MRSQRFEKKKHCILSANHPPMVIAPPSSLVV